ncbi:phage integrase N-terminal SAM-like domain-containing protein [Candidatus Aerophobetes bacterium]|nr:phage integrase N-terminal SAM-like domain-containing protein [Candidatus Aerophobetes bacterium]
MISIFYYFSRVFTQSDGKRHPEEMGEEEVSQFLTWLATKKKVAASTQNQALCRSSRQEVRS